MGSHTLPEEWMRGWEVMRVGKVEGAGVGEGVENVFDMKKRKYLKKFKI